MTADASFGINQIGQISIRATNTSESVEFYRDKLGIPLLFEAPPKLAFFQCGDIRLMVSEPEEGFDHASSVFYFKVDDIESAHATMQERGVVFRDEPHLVHKMPDHELWMCFFLDPAENTMALMCEKR